MSVLVVRTAQLSLALQLLTGIVTLVGFAVPVSAHASRVDDIYLILGIETASQVIEFLYYLVALFWFKGAISTWTRYIDWFVSTPAMLLSTAMFFVHRADGDVVQVLDPVASPFMYVALAFNALMLSFGLASELSAVPRFAGLLLGAAAFTASFSFLARYVNDDDVLSEALFYCIFGVWYLYGVAAALPYEPKNVMYNLLDVVAKNFYGVFLFVYLLML